MGKIKYVAALLLAVACVGLQQAKADFVTYDLSQGNPAIFGYTGAYAMVTFNRTDSTHAAVRSPR